jgi:serine/threonine protein kinase
MCKTYITNVRHPWHPQNMNQRDQSRSSPSLNDLRFDASAPADGQDTTLLVGNASGIHDSVVFQAPHLSDGKLKPLELVGENYEIISLIGVGGMGYVYRVRHRILQKQYAMKTLSAQQVTDTAWRRLQIEAQAIARMSHPNIVGIHNLGLHEGWLPYYVMDLLEGEALADILKIKGKISLAEALPIFIEACTGLAYAHRKGIIHRDIKPGNLVVLKEPDSGGARVKIVDFGIAKLSGASDPSNQKLTSIGEVFGSPYYMSPEQCLGKRIDGRSDIYSMGCTLFEALVGHPPFRGANPVNTMMMHQSQDAPTLEQASGRKFPEAIEDVVAKLLAKAPMDRYQSLDKVAEDLQAIQAGREISTNNLFKTPSNTHPKTQSKTHSKTQLNTQRSLDARADDQYGNDDSENDEDGEESRRMLGKKGYFVATIAGTVATVVILMVVFAVRAFQSPPPASNLAAKAMPAKNKSAANSKATKISTTYGAVTTAVKPATSGAKKSTAETAKLAPFSQIITDKNGKLLRHFEFPTNDFIGRMSVQSARSQRWSAQGPHDFAASDDLHFDASPQFMANLKYFERFRPDDLYGVSLMAKAMPQQESNQINDFVFPDSYDSDITRALEYLPRLTSLRELNIDRCKNANDSHVKQLNNLPWLVELTLDNTNFTGPGIVKLKYLRKLKTLHFGRNQGIPELLKALSGSENLRWLRLGHPRGTTLTMADYKLIASCKNIERLDLDGCGMNNKILAVLATMPNLKYFCAQEGMLNESCIPILKKMPALKAVNFESPSWTGTAEAELNAQMPHLQRVIYDH